MLHNRSLLDVRELRTYFPASKGLVRAVDGVDITLCEGEAVGIVGESGSGKTVTALSIMRLVPPPGKVVSGKVVYKGRNLLDSPDEELRRIRGKEITMVFQDPMSYLNPVMKVGDQIAEAILLHSKMQRRAAQRETLKALSDMGIPAPARVYECYPHELSGGMKQRALIAMAVWCNPTVIILDEPTTALDVTVQAQILDLLSGLKQSGKLSFLLITHDLAIAAEVCDRIYVMYGGKIVETADVYELYGNPKHPYTQGLLQSVLSIDEFREKLVVLEGTVPNLMDPPSGCRFHPRCHCAMAVCSDKDPVPTEVGNQHRVFCWLYSGEEKP